MSLLPDPYVYVCDYHLHEYTIGIRDRISRIITSNDLPIWISVGCSLTISGFTFFKMFSNTVMQTLYSENFFDSAMELKSEPTKSLNGLIWALPRCHNCHAGKGLKVGRV